MAKETERKFLVTDTSYRRLAHNHEEITQGYLSTAPDATVRVRIKGSMAFLTVKTRNIGATRDEWEYPIPPGDARDMLSAPGCSAVIDKTRYYVNHGGLTWEVDEFHGRHEGLVVAEVELEREDAPYEKPPFAGDEVTGDPRYYNSTLARE